MSKAEKKRLHIIEKAALIFNEKGIAGTSIDEILEASHTTKGCLYGHFNSKEELSYASVDYLLQKLTDRRTLMLEKQTTAAAKIFAFLDMNKDPLNSYINGGCPIVNLSTETDDTNPVIRKKVKHMIETALKLFSDILKTGVATGEISKALDADEFAAKMFMSVEGANAVCRTMNSNKYMHQVIKSLKSELNTYVLPSA